MFFQPKDEWHTHSVFFSVRSLTGERIYGPIMRRKINAQWQYREMTADEADKWRELNVC